MTEQGYTNFYDRSETTQYEYEDLGSNNAQMAKVFNVYSSKEQVRYVSLIGRINYSYDNRYIATFTLRRDATSRFINDKWGTFLSGALAWNIDSERFMQNQNTVSPQTASESGRGWQLKCPHLGLLLAALRNELLLRNH